MSVKMYVELQEDSVELTIKAKNVGGKSASVSIGWRMKTTSEMEADGLLNRLKAAEAEVDLEAMKIVKEEDTDEVNAILHEHCLYIKGATFTTEVDNKPTKMTVRDSREQQPMGQCWANAEECKDFILDGFLDSPAWRNQLIQSFASVINNTQIDTSKNSKR